VIIRLNTIISKYGLSPELVHFSNVLDTHLPVITDISLHTAFDSELDLLSFDFKNKINKFLHNKRLSKTYYKKGKLTAPPFSLHEIVMRKIYNPPSLLHATFTGPYRIIKLSEKGALLKCPKSGDSYSVHYENIRKITPDEFLTILPSHFDSEIINNLDLYRYNRRLDPDPPPAILPRDSEPELFFKTGAANLSSQDYRKLRSGKSIKLNTNLFTSCPPSKTATFKQSFDITPVRNKICTTILKRVVLPVPTPYATITQTYDNGLWLFNSKNFHNPPNEILPNYKKRYKSNFNSPLPGQLIIDLPPQDNKALVTFSTITVNFY
jgi:hypothetical protein